jgi:hypothetical protein
VQRIAGQTPENAKELFNLRHSSLRNVIERIFGVVKRKFKILDVAAEYSIQTQIHIALAVLGLANFITMYEGISAEELDAAEAEIQDEDGETGDELELGTTVESSDMALKRDQYVGRLLFIYTRLNKQTFYCTAPKWPFSLKKYIPVVLSNHLSLCSFISGCFERVTKRVALSGFLRQSIALCMSSTQLHRLLGKLCREYRNSF